MATCETTDFTFPLLVDVFYPIVKQGAYGSIEKSWVLDKTIACNFNSVGSADAEDIKPNVNITQQLILLGRVKTDIRISSRENQNAVTNVILTNIRTSDGVSIYQETSGVRAGKPTIFEIASNEPYVGPFRNVEFFNVVIRRSENQGVDV